MTDELKIVADIVGSAAGDAKDVIILWLMYKIGLNILGWCGAFGMVAIAARVIRRIAGVCSDTNEIARAAGFSTPLLSSDKERILQYIAEGRKRGDSRDSIY